MFDRWSISGRYLVFGDKADLSQLKALELYELASSMWTVRMTRTSPMPDRFTRASFFFRHRRIGARDSPLTRISGLSLAPAAFQDKSSSSDLAVQVIWGRISPVPRKRR